MKQREKELNNEKGLKRVVALVMWYKKAVMNGTPNTEGFHYDHSMDIHQLYFCRHAGLVNSHLTYCIDKTQKAYASIKEP